MNGIQGNAGVEAQHELHRLLGAAINDSTYLSLELQRLVSAIDRGTPTAPGMEGQTLGGQLSTARQSLARRQADDSLTPAVESAITVGLGGAARLTDFRNRLAHDRWLAKNTVDNLTEARSYSLSVVFDERITTNYATLRHIATMFFEAAGYLRALADVVSEENSHPGGGIAWFESKHGFNVERLADNLPCAAGPPWDLPDWRWDSAP